MKKAFIVIAAVVLPFQAGAATYTLQEILQVAGESSDQVKVIAYEYEAGRQQVKFYRSEAWPMVNLSANTNYVSRSNIGVSSGFGGGLGGGGGQGSPLGKRARALGDTLPQGDSLSQTPAAQGDPFAGIERYEAIANTWSITLRQPLLTFGRVSNALALAGTQDSVLELTREMQINLLYLSVMQSFSEAYLAQRQVAIAKKSVASAEKLLQRMRIEVENGAGSRLDLLRVEAQYSGAKAGFLTAQSSSDIALLRLAQTAGLKVDTAYTLAVDTTTELTIADLPAEGASAEYQLKGLMATLRRDQADYERSRFFPSISLIAGIDASAYYLRGIDEQIQEMVNPPNTAIVEPRFYNYAVGLNLSWTLFDGFRRNAATAQALAQARQAQVEQKQIREENEISIREGRDRLGVLDESMEAVSAQLGAAQRAMELVEGDYSRGYVDITTYLQTEQEVREAEKRLYELRMQRLLTIAQLRFNLGLPVYEES